MDIENLTIGQARKLANLFCKEGTVDAPAENGRAVIVRSRDAGVQFGYLQKYEGRTVYLKNARQMWQWKAAQGGSLLDCATYGVTKSGCKFSSPNASVIVFDACAIIDCTDAAVNSIGDVKWA